MKIITFSNGVIGKNLLKILKKKGIKINLNVWTGDQEELIVNKFFFEDVAFKTMSWLEFRHYQNKAPYLKFNWLLNLWNSKILKKEDLDISEKTLNIHPGVIPYTKGCDCATWAIQKSYPAGITLMEMNEKIDDGDIYCIKKLIYNFPISGKELNIRIKKETLSFFSDNVLDIISGKLKTKKAKMLGNYFSRKDTIENSLYDISSNKNILEFLNWALSHQFPNDRLPTVIYKNKKYELNIKMLHKT